MNKKILILGIIIIAIIIYFIISPQLIKNVNKTQDDNTSVLNNVNFDMTKDCIYREDVTQWCLALNEHDLSGCENIKNNTLRTSCIDLKIIERAVEEENSELCNKSKTGFSRQVCSIFTEGNVHQACQNFAEDRDITLDFCLDYFNGILSKSKINITEDQYFLRAIANNDPAICENAKIYFSYIEDNETNVFNSEIPCKQLLDDSFIADCDSFVEQYCQKVKNAILTTT